MAKKRACGEERAVKRLALLLAVLTALSLTLPAFAAEEDTGEKLIAITYDDGPSAYTEELLDGLKERGAHATFFIVGRSVKARKATVRRAWEEGHQIASHTWDHPSLTGIGDNEIRSQLSRTAAALTDALGFELEYMLRPPYGSHNQRVLNAAGVPSVFWSMDTSDYLTKDPEVVRSQIMKAARDGAVCCLHDTHESTVKGSLMAMDELIDEGYELVTVAELFYRRGVEMKAGSIYSKAYPGTTSSAVAEPAAITRLSGNGLTVELVGDDRGEIRYTLDGSLPTPANGEKYSSPIELDGPATIRAVSVIDWNGIRSETAELSITMPPRAGLTVRRAGDRLFVFSESPGARVFASERPGGVYTLYAEAPGMRRSGIVTLTRSPGGRWLSGEQASDGTAKRVDRVLDSGLPSLFGEPGEIIRRSDAFEMLFALCGKGEKCPDPEFSDVKPEDGFYEAVAWVKAKGIALGYRDGTVYPERLLKREDLSVMLSRLAGRDIRIPRGTGPVTRLELAEAVSILMGHN